MPSAQQEGMQFIIVFVLSIALMAADHYGQILGNLRSAILTTLTPIERLASIPHNVYTLVTTDFTTYEALEKQNQQLQTENLLLKARQQQFTNLELQVARLQALLGTTGKITNQEVQIASVIYYSNSPLSQFITLNKGHLDKVNNQQVVIDSYGIMGQIIEYTPTTSRTLLITDPDHQIPVRIQRTGQRGILQGTGYDNAQLNFIPVNSEIKIGDTLESSGLGGIFPAGYPVATITKIETQGDQPYLKVLAAPVAKLDQSHQVLIISQEEKEAWETDFDLELDFDLNTEQTQQQTNAGVAP